MWERRHRGILAVLFLHAAGLTAFGLARGAPIAHVLLEGAIVGAFGLLAGLPRLGRRMKSIISALGLMSASAILVHLSGGYIEAHFHFFVMLGVIFLYEDWLPYVLAVAYVAAHHGVAGSLDPLSVYNHPAAIAEPWRWAGVHAVFILGLSAALIVAWNAIERSRRSETAAITQASDLKRQLHTQEKMAALGSLVAGLAHEVRTPLTVVGTNASMLEMAARREPTNPLSSRMLVHAEEIRGGVDRINALVRQLRRFHALAPEETRVTPLDVVVRDAVQLFASANKATRTIHDELEPTPDVRVDPLGVQQIVLNLLANAVEATDPARGVVSVRTFAAGGSVVLEVEDNGLGMPLDVQRHAFDPLFTTKSEGMGLGLHIVKRIADAHGASIHLRSSEGAGTRFTLRFPVAQATEGSRETHVPVDIGAAPIASPSPP